mmetsp:Transcript_28360/g.66576  ORF Transcript_28360/g.66576 Transcript_28360/m.66576 type:complete len:211 (+) Transcript_28360:1030-1662(+)
MTTATSLTTKTTMPAPRAARAPSPTSSLCEVPKIPWPPTAFRRSAEPPSLDRTISLPSPARAGTICPTASSPCPTMTTRSVASTSMETTSPPCLVLDATRASSSASTPLAMVEDVPLESADSRVTRKRRVPPRRRPERRGTARLPTAAASASGARSSSTTTRPSSPPSTSRICSSIPPTSSGRTSLTPRIGIRTKTVRLTSSRIPGEAST